MHRGRGFRLTLLGVATLVAAALGSGVSASSGAQTPDREITLRLPLTIADNLPARARTALTEEAGAIWRREGVRLQWFVPTDELTGSGAVLPVLVGDLLTSSEGEAWPVGELRPDPSGGRIALASIPAARHVLASAGLGADTQNMQAQRLGVILGRAVAHEIGHYLLSTRSHARYGLMRAQIDVRDFADPRDGRFFLDSDASRWLHAVFSQGLLSEKGVARFAY